MTIWKKPSQYLGASVAVLPLVLGVSACSGSASESTPTKTVTATVTLPPEPVTPEPSVTISPSSTPPSKATPTAKVTPTKKPKPKPTVKPKPGQDILFPVKETANGDPGGVTWAEVGIYPGGEATCNPIREKVALKLNGTRQVGGSAITVIETTEGWVITTDSVLPATAFVLNREGAAKVPDTWHDAANLSSKRTLLLPKIIWTNTLGGKVRSITACAIRAR